VGRTHPRLDDKLGVEQSTAAVPKRAGMSLGLCVVDRIVPRIAHVGRDLMPGANSVKLELCLGSRIAGRKVPGISAKGAVARQSDEKEAIRGFVKDGDSGAWELGTIGRPQQALVVADSRFAGRRRHRRELSDHGPRLHPI
jgi:hypothetical protein